MPMYDYECPDCGVIERQFSMDDVQKSVKCECGKKATRVFTVPNRIIRFKNIVMKPENIPPIVICLDPIIGNFPYTDHKINKDIDNWSNQVSI